MSDDLEYFTEFLNDPSVPEINEFWRMLRRWLVYINEHKDEFNYLEDDEWKEVRERLIAVLEIRVDEKDRLCEEFDELTAICEDTSELSDDEVAASFNRTLEFMKRYRYVFDFKEENIGELEKKGTNFLKSIEDARESEERLRQAKIKLNESIAKFDDEIVEYYERTGKRVVLPSYRDKKVYKGN